MTTDIVELASDEEFASAFGVMHELRTNVDEERYLDLLAEMRASGYRLFAAREDDGIVALAGVGRGTNLYYGRYLWVYDLVTTTSERSKGHGERLLTYLESLARSLGCETIALSSALHRVDAHRFYEDRAGFERASYTFTKAVRDP